ncbi:MAG: asparagine synthase (glutamine-hydrolyzing) [Phycisphaerales bacterium]|jgi:asparagine synthase (glutamine-hydrolysing)|nr:asparagine synthase (glutamine-hydrolyzing) [Phycisphaerales bacterium]
MCGIAGILRVHPPESGPPLHPLEAIPEAWLDVLDDSILHRGPDGQGRFRDRATRPDGSIIDVALVHRRLSIIDHAGGHQPMVHDGERLRTDLTYARGETPKLAHELCPPGEPTESSNGRRGLVAVVFNGCIYNHRELRTELTSLGHRFETDHADTEVLVHGWREWDDSSLDKIQLAGHLDGMFALAVWDRAKERAYLARDQAGEKPLYFTTMYPKRHGAHDLDQRSGYELAFGSAFIGVESIAQELRQMGRVVDRKPIACQWLIFGHAAQLVSKRVEPMPPHHTASSPISHVRPYSSAAMNRERELQSASPTRGTGAMTAGLLESQLHRSMSSRLEADAPIGVFLSGGLDSALIAALAHTRRPDIKAFTVRMPHPDYDESAAAARTAKAIGIDHTILDCEPNPATDLVHLIEELGLPFGDSSLLPTYWVCKAAREHAKVALSGDGGDELFGGYRRHTVNATLNRWRPLLRLIPSTLLDQRNPSTRSTYLARLATAALYAGYPDLLAIFPTPDLRRLIGSVDGEPAGDGTFRPIDDPLRYDFEHYLPDDLLRKTDTASMSVALEVRAPFLARELVEAALRTPLSVLMPRGERKGLLKRVARKYLPDEIVDRPKRGFAIPIGEWFRSDFGGMRQLLYDHLESADPFPGLADAGVNIDMGFVRTMLREHDAAGEKSINPWHGRDHSQRLYMLLVLSIWSRWLARVRETHGSTESRAPTLAE